MTDDDDGNDKDDDSGLVMLNLLAADCKKRYINYSSLV